MANVPSLPEKQIELAHKKAEIMLHAMAEYGPSAHRMKIFEKEVKFLVNAFACTSILVGLQHGIRIVIQYASNTYKVHYNQGYHHLFRIHVTLQQAIWASDS